MPSIVERREEIDLPGTQGREVNHHGRAIAMTVFSPVRPWYRRAPPPAKVYHRGVPWLRLVFTGGRAIRSPTITNLSFIHFARWIVIRRLPDYGQPHDRLQQPLLMFESNYNGSFDQYIDGFAHILTEGMTLIWGTSHGFPGPTPVAPFKKYIEANQFTANHYYSAYPEATTTMIKAALAVEELLPSLTERAAAVDSETFAADYRRLLTRLQDEPRPAEKEKRSLGQTIGAFLREVGADGSRSGRSYAITLLTPIRPGAEEELTACIEGLETGTRSPLAMLPSVHFGRWVVIDQLKSSWSGAPANMTRLKSQYLLFSACVTAPVGNEMEPAKFLEWFLNEIWEAKVSEEANRPAEDIWGHCLGYPAAADAQAFVDYLARSRINTSLFHVGYPDVTVAEVRHALDTRDKFFAFALKHQGEDSAVLQEVYVRESAQWFH